MYVCKYDGKPPLFSELRNLKWQYSGCSMVCINKCFAPWKSKKRKTNTHAVSALLDPALLFGLYRTLLHLYREPMNAALCVRAHTVCPEYHCWVLVHVCVCAVGVGGLSGSFAGPGTFGLCPMYRSGLWAQRWISGQETPLTCPFSVVAPVHSYLLNV